MAQKVKIQDGVVRYSSADPALALDFTVDGNATVTNQLTLGTIDTLPANGFITTNNGSISSSPILTITTGTYGKVRLLQNSTSGSLTLNEIQWPSGSVNTGMFLGASSSNILEFYPYVLGYESSDFLTESDLNILYPAAQVGQSAIGPNVVYYVVGALQWRILSGGSPTANTPYRTITYTASNTATDQVIDTVDITLYRAVSYKITITDGSAYEYTEINLLYDDINVSIGQINTMPATPELVTFTADISGGFLRLLSSPTVIGTTYNAVATLIASTTIVPF